MQALRAKDYPTAVSVADAVLATHPTHPEDCRILVMRGMALRGEGRADDSLQSFLETAAGSERKSGGFGR